MSFSPGAEEAATGITGLALALFAKFKFVTKNDFNSKQLDCQTHLSEKISALSTSQDSNFKEIFKQLHDFTLHQGKVERDMELRNGVSKG